jgi:hypothetical protein
MTSFAVARRGVFFSTDTLKEGEVGSRGNACEACMRWSGLTSADLRGRSEWFEDGWGGWGVFLGTETFWSCGSCETDGRLKERAKEILSASR